jgi:hypothetical protein
MIIMRKKWRIIGFISLMLSLILIGCNNDIQARTDGDTNSHEKELPPVSAIQARKSLADQLSVNLDEITILSTEQTIWLDSCLGLGGIAESCLRTEVEGWIVKLSLKGQVYIAHTDWLGEQVRFEP